MSLVMHISDPHFGSQDPVIAEELLAELDGLAPALIVISGDLTQRARRAQFEQARAWLDRLRRPYLVVPGNSDIARLDVIRRFARPRERYCEYITQDLTPCFIDDEVAVCGVDTTHSFTTKHGRITQAQVEHAAAQLAPHTHHWRVLVAHHPFVVPEGSGEPTVDGAGEALALLEAAGVDLIVTGHLHIPHSESAAGRNDRHTVINVHAGTCMSTRLRHGEPNGYNQLRFDGDRVAIVHRVWDGTRFINAGTKYYRRGGGIERITKIVEVLPPPELVAP